MLAVEAHVDADRGERAELGESAHDDRSEGVVDWPAVDYQVKAGAAADVELDVRVVVSAHAVVSAVSLCRSSRGRDGAGKAGP